MGSFIQILVFVIMGTALLWFGYMLIIGQLGNIRKYRELAEKGQSFTKGTPGHPRVCPICSSRLPKGERVKTRAFPSITGGKDRLMHVQGCTYCLDGSKPRNCPVCGASLEIDEFLVSRIFERSLRRNHVHILGCSKCRRVGKPQQDPPAADLE